MNEKLNMEDLNAPVQEVQEEKDLKESYDELEKTVEENKARKSRPDFRIVQPTVDMEGKQNLNNVGAMWKNVSKNGNIFYTLKIGDLKLLVFPNK